MNKRNLFYYLITSLLFFTFLSGALAAERYPTKEIQVVTSVVPGGFLDLALRLMSDNLGKNLGVPIIVVNRGVAGEATHFLINTKPDGYNIGCLSSREMVVASATIPGYPYKYSELDPLCKYASSITVVFCKADAPWKSLEELVADAKKRPGQITYGATTNSNSYFTMVEFQKAAGFNMLHIPLKAAGQTITRILGGNLDIGISSLTPCVGQLKAGTLRGLFLTTSERVSTFPQIPTLKEKGYGDVHVFDLWAGFFAPLRMPIPIRGTLEKALEKTIKDPAVKKRLEDMETVLDYLPAEAFAKEIEGDYKLIIKIVGTTKPQK